MHKLAQNLALIIAMSLLIIACGSTSAASYSKTIIVTPAIKGNSTDLEVGDTLELQIPTIPNSGFEWQVQDLDTKILKQEGIGTYTKDPNNNSAGGIVTFQFTAIGSGSTTIKLLYVNSPVGTIPALSSNSFSMIVDVK